MIIDLYATGMNWRDIVIQVDVEPRIYWHTLAQCGGMPQWARIRHAEAIKEVNK